MYMDLGIFDINNVLPLDVLVERGFTDDEKETYLVGYNKVRKTQGLFIDMETVDRSANMSSVFCITDARPLHYKTYNGMARYDMRQLYLACGDITEVVFVDKFLYDYSQWEKICKNSVLGPFVEKWRKEQRLSVKSSMFNVLLDDALDPTSKTKTSSAKYLLEKYYDPNTKNAKQKLKDKEKDNADLIMIREDEERLSDLFVKGKMN